jgi:hypothetical protein
MYQYILPPWWRCRAAAEGVFIVECIWQYILRCVLFENIIQIYI